MGFGKFLFGAGAIVGGIILAPVVAPVAAATAVSAAAAAGATAAAAAGTVAAAGAAAGATAAAAAGTVAAAGTAVGTAVASTAVGSAVIGGATATAGVATGVATGAATAVASSAVGTAVGAGMATVGGAVGTAAGTVGLAHVATVAGTTAGATALGTITTSGVVGGVSAVSGVSKMSKASSIANEAKSLYSSGREEFDYTERQTNEALEELGKQKLFIWEKFSVFENTFSRIRNLEIQGEAKIEKKLSLDVNRLEQVYLLAESAKAVIKDGTISLSSGQLIGAACATGITSVATASTGTAIASLHGIAAYNASMAALGGGALKAGGLGIAGGKTVLSAMTFAPALAVGGLFLNARGGKSLKDAKESKEEAEKLVQQMKQAVEQMNKLQDLSSKLSETIRKYEMILDNLLQWLIELTNRECDASFYTDKEITKCYASYRIVEILYDLTTTELFSTNDDKTVVHSVKIDNAVKNSEIKWDEYREAV